MDIENIKAVGEIVAIVMEVVIFHYCAAAIISKVDTSSYVSFDDIVEDARIGEIEMKSAAVQARSIHVYGVTAECIIDDFRATIPDFNSTTRCFRTVITGNVYGITDDQVMRYYSVGVV